MFRPLPLIVALVLGATIVLLTDGSQAGDKPKPKGQQLPTYWKQLGLSKEQTQKVYEINARYRTQIDELETKIKDLNAKMVEERFQLLSQTQKEQLRKIIASKVGGDSGKTEKKPEVKKPSEKSGN